VLHRALRPHHPTAIAVCALALQFAALSAAGAVTWTPRGAFADREFTSLVSPAGYPCIIAFTALSNGGLAVSSDCGEEYAPLLSASVHSVMARDTNVGWVAAGGLGVVKTTNTGATWFPVNDGLPMMRDARTVQLHLGNPDTIYVGLYGGGVFEGGPGADSLVAWQPMNDGLGDLRVRHLARVRGGTYFLAATDGGIYRWEGNAWTLREPGLVANRLLIDASDSARVYAVGPSGVYKSTNAGLAFTPSSTGLPAGVEINDISRRTDIPNVLYAGTRGSGVFESLDYGSSWHAFGPAVPGENDVRAILVVVESAGSVASVFAGTRRDGLFEAEYSTRTLPTTWGRIKSTYR
jgi:hypothetical protein